MASDSGEEFGKFVLRGVLGKGGMGSVYEAWNRESGETVALKILPRFLAGDKEFLDRFMREARAIGQLAHPNIVAFKEFGEISGSYFLSMEFVQGLSLPNAFPRLPVQEETAVRVMRQVAQAVHYAHTSEQGIIHRDLKPGNIIIITGDTTVKIIDFGLSKIASEATLTVTGTQLGTPAYMAPEQFGNSKVVDHRSDIWSIGVIFYELLAGERPIPGKKIVQLVKCINDPGFKIPPLRGLNLLVSGETERIVHKCLKFSPDERYCSVEHLLSELDGKDYIPRVSAYDPMGTYRIGTRIEHPALGQAGWVIHKGKTGDRECAALITVSWERAGIRVHAAEAREKLRKTIMPFGQRCPVCGRRTLTSSKFCGRCGARCEHESAQTPSPKKYFAVAAAVIAVVILAAVITGTASRFFLKPPTHLPGAANTGDDVKREKLAAANMAGGTPDEIWSRVLGTRIVPAKGFGSTNVYRTEDDRCRLWIRKIQPNGTTLNSSVRVAEKLKNGGAYFVVVQMSDLGQSFIIPGDIFSPELIAQATFRGGSRAGSSQQTDIVFQDGKWTLAAGSQHHDVTRYLNAFELVLP